MLHLLLVHHTIQHLLLLILHLLEVLKHHVLGHLCLLDLLDRLLVHPWVMHLKVGVVLHHAHVAR